MLDELLEDVVVLPSSRLATVGTSVMSPRTSSVRLAIGLVDDAAGRANVVVRDRVDDVGQREARRSQGAAGLTLTWIDDVTSPFS